MGYKRMKKRKLTFDRRSKFMKWFRNFNNRLKGKLEIGGEFIEVDWSEQKKKWFESPNAEGYLDM